MVGWLDRRMGWDGWIETDGPIDGTRLMKFNRGKQYSFYKYQDFTQEIRHHKRKIIFSELSKTTWAISSSKIKFFWGRYTEIISVFVRR